jgi:hypothetical protein
MGFLDYPPIMCNLAPGDDHLDESPIQVVPNKTTSEVCGLVWNPIVYI